MNSDSNADMLDTVLTLRGHQITLRQAMAEGLVRGYFDPKTGQARIYQFDAKRSMGRPDTPKSA